MPPSTKNNVSVFERRRALRKYLSEFYEIGLADACKRFGASSATMRRDFYALSKAGQAVKEWGVLKSAVAPSTLMPPFSERERVQAGAKAAIGRAAAELVMDEDVVLIDGGTTTLELVPHLAVRRVKIVTNSIAIAHAIDRQRHGRIGAEVFLTGGQLYPNSFMLVGPQAKATLARYRARWAFLSAAGIDAGGVSNSNELVVEIEQAMIAHAERVALLADASKFGRRSMVQLCGIGDVHTLVTDAGLSGELSHLFSKAGVEVRIAAGRPGDKG
jgi:DeoR/GlpR family transcriptional regulator of sugar metabolism